MKTMALRLEDDLHSQLAILAQLSDSSIAEIVRVALVDFVVAKRGDPTLAAQAESVLAEIDASARSRRDAIATLFGDKASSGVTELSAKGGGNRSSRKPSA
jgi:predicted transcriptional regulator